MIKKQFIYKKGLYKLKGKTKEVKVFGFDVETYDNNQEISVMSIVGKDYKKFFYTRKELYLELSSNQIFRNSLICATNLTFDLTAFMPITELFNNSEIIERQGGIILAITYVKYDKNDFKLYSKATLDNIKLKLSDEDKKDFMKDYYPIKFIDSLNHLKCSVKALGEIINLKKLECNLIGTMPDNKKDMEELKIYNMRDSEITYKFMDWLQNEYNIMGANLKVTISSSALDLYRRRYLNVPVEQENKNIIDTCYKGYYGGRTEVFKRGYFNKENYGKLFYYDVNSLYPYCMKAFKYPLPRKSYLKKKCTADDIDSFEGLCYIELRSNKDILIPLLPVKSDKLYFPTGIIKGYYDFSSIRMALNNEYEIINIGEGVIYEHTFTPFKSYVKDLYEKRNEYKKTNDNRQLIPKILMNSLYGKFGYNYKNKENLVSLERYAYLSSIYDYKVSGIPYGDGFNVFRCFMKDFAKPPSYVFPIWSIYVTSYARQLMYKKFKEIGNKRVFYTDTDSIISDRNIGDSKELGELKKEMIFDELCLVKPKMYSGITTEKTDYVKVKGVKGNIDTFNGFYELVQNGFEVKNIQLFTKLRTALSYGKPMNSVYTINKKLDLEDNKRLWDKKYFTINPQNSTALNFNYDSYIKV